MREPGTPAMEDPSWQRTCALCIRIGRGTDPKQLPRRVALPLSEIEDLELVVAGLTLDRPVHVPHYRLGPNWLPAPGAPWHGIKQFADTFEGRQAGYDGPNGSSARTLQAFAAGDEVTGGLTDVRVGLFWLVRSDRGGGGYGFEEGSRELQFARALVKRLWRLIEADEHRRPSTADDKVCNAFDRFMEGYSRWGGHAFHGWTNYDDPANFLGTTVLSERDCCLRLAMELEKEWPAGVHLDFAINKSTRADIDPDEKRQHVDIVASGLPGFEEDGQSMKRLRTHRHGAFVEAKWLLKGWRGNAFEMDARKRVRQIEVDLAKLARHLAKQRCEVAAMFVVDDEDYFGGTSGFESTPLTNQSRADWPSGVWRLVAGPAALRARNLLPPLTAAR